MMKSFDILLVEDNPYDIELTLHAFKKSKISNGVLVLRDGAEALNYLFCTGPYTGRSIENQPKVILLDLKLPLVDGLEVIQRVKADLRTQAIPIVVLTSSREDPNISRSYQLGVNSYIVKPVDFGQFVECTRSVGLYWLLLNQPPASPT